MKKIIITGHVGHDASVQVLNDGTEFVKFSVGIAVGTKQTPKTDWVDISCNGKLADVARNYVRKGTKVLVEGFPTVNAYLSRDNRPMGSLRIYANNIELLSPKNEDSSFQEKPDYVEEKAKGDTLESDDIPF